jgi:hypothetical protein
MQYLLGKMAPKHESYYCNLQYSGSPPSVNSWTEAVSLLLEEQTELHFPKYQNH